MLQVEHVIGGLLSEACLLIVQVQIHHLCKETWHVSCQNMGAEVVMCSAVGSAWFCKRRCYSC